jgi:hypothetical protein
VGGYPSDRDRAGKRIHDHIDRQDPDERRQNSREAGSGARP